MTYQIAYGVNQGTLRKRQLIDAFIVASMNNDTDKMNEIFNHLLPNTAAPAQKAAGKPAATNKEPFSHLRGGK